MVHPELEVWIRERDPKTAEKAAELAEVFLAARKGSNHATYGRNSTQPQRDQDGEYGYRDQAQSKSDGGERSFGQNRTGSIPRQFTSSRYQKPNTANSSYRPIKEVRCYRVMV